MAGLASDTALRQTPNPVFPCSSIHHKSSIPSFALRRFTLETITAAIELTGVLVLPAYAADTIKVGTSHSLLDTLAIFETVLKDIVLMAIDEINAKGGVMGKQLEPVIVDLASN